MSKLVVHAAKGAENTLRQIDDADDPGPIVRALEPYDLLLTWNAADDEQRGELLRFAEKEQTDLLIDLSCWQGDTPDIDALCALFAPLALGNPMDADRALHLLGDELRTLLFKRSCKIHVLENRNDELLVPDTSELIPCPDGSYFIELVDPDLVTDAERSLLQALLLRPFEEYQPELECVRHDLASELTEQAYRWHTGRLADFGFATKEAARSLLAPMSVSEILRAAESALPIVRFPNELSLPVLYRDNLSGNEFLDSVLDAVRNSSDPDTQHRADVLNAELAAMTNLYLSAAGVDIGNVEAVAQNIAWVRDLMSLGLIETSDGDEDEAIRLFCVLSPGVFVRAAFGVLYPLQKRARALLNDKKLIPPGRRGAIFDPPYFIALSCLSRDIPCRWPMLDTTDQPSHSLFEPSPKDLAAFSSRKEVEAALLLLEEAEQLPTLLFDALKCEQPPVRGTPASILLMNALANASAEKEPTAKPILKEEANVFAAELLLLTEEQLLADALTVLTPLVYSDLLTAEETSDDPDPMKRLLIKLIRIGRSRLAADAPERGLLIESF
jgi:hypothetical protein